MSKNVAEVIKNIRYFVTEILPPAYGKSNWSTESVRHAVQWAAYCEAVAVEISLQPYIRTALKELEANGTVTSLSELKTANEILFSALIFNQLIPAEVKTDVLFICTETLGDTRRVQLENICKEKHNSFKKVSKYLQESSCEKYFKTFKIRAIIEYCKNSDDFSKLNCILCSKGSLRQVLDLLDKVADNERYNLLIVYGRWINSELEKNSTTMIREIAMLPKDDLVMLNNTFDNFREKILKAIKESGDIVSKKYNYPADDHYKYIILMLQTLLASELRNCTINSVSMWLATGDACFWHKVYSDASNTSS